MRWLPSALAALLAAGVMALAASAAPSPTALAAGLRAAAYPDTALPGTYSSASLGRLALASHSRANGAVGAVEADVDGPDSSAGVVFLVFKSQAGAHADSGSSPVTTSGLTLKKIGKAPGFPAGTMFAGTVTHTDALGVATTDQATVVVAQQGNVLVAGFTYSTVKSGNAHGAIMLLRSGLNHLAKLSARH